MQSQRVAPDGFSTIALFALYPLLKKETRFAIRGRAIVVQEPYEITVPLISQRINLTSLQRILGSDSREDASLLDEGIRRGLLSYREDKNFRKILPFTKDGLGVYAVNYGQGNASKTLELSQKRIEDIEFLTASNEAKEAFWKVDEIHQVANHILEAFRKKEKNMSFLPELNAALTFILTKQNETFEGEFEKLNVEEAPKNPLPPNEVKPPEVAMLYKE